jgi:hypothetical protein
MCNHPHHDYQSVYDMNHFLNNFFLLDSWSYKQINTKDSYFELLQIENPNNEDIANSIKLTRKII